MKLRLFAIRDTQTGKLVPDIFAPSKPEAKKERDRLNSEVGEGRIRYVVTNGPDHYKSQRLA